MLASMEYFSLNTKRQVSYGLQNKEDLGDFMIVFFYVVIFLLVQTLFNIILRKENVYTTKDQYKTIHGMLITFSVMLLIIVVIIYKKNNPQTFLSHYYYINCL
jgi:hypothetical protein